jgi:uracil-DNA glycosylase
MSMTPTDRDLTDLSQILPWLVEMGADEVLFDQPVDRFVAATAAVAAVAPEVKPRAPLLAAPPKPVVNWKAVAAGAEGVAAAEALAASIHSLESYHDALDHFDAHPLRKTADRTCSFMGNPNPRVLVLCDRPRNEEDRTGEVLSGSAQVLAMRMLAAIGLTAFTDAVDDNAVALANFIPWRPPGNRSLTELEAQMLVPFAQKLLALLRPKAILCFGHLPGQYLAGGEDAIMRARGQWRDVAGIPLLTTFHPDTLLKSAASKRLAWHDLQAFRQKLDTLS